MKIIPFGNRILVKRRTIGEKVGTIVMPDSAKSRNTDLADVTYVPDLTFSDEKIINNAEKIIEALTNKAMEGNVKAAEGLLDMNTFIKLKSIKVGDAVMISKYVGIDFHATGADGNQTLVNCEDVIGLVCE